VRQGLLEEGGGWRGTPRSGELLCLWRPRGRAVEVAISRGEVAISPGVGAGLPLGRNETTAVWPSCDARCVAKSIGRSQPATIRIRPGPLTGSLNAVGERSQPLPEAGTMPKTNAAHALFLLFAERERERARGCTTCDADVVPLSCALHAPWRAFERLAGTCAACSLIGVAVLSFAERGQLCCMVAHGHCRLSSASLCRHM